MYMGIDKITLLPTQENAQTVILTACMHALETVEGIAEAYHGTINFTQFHY